MGENEKQMLREVRKIDVLFLLIIAALLIGNWREILHELIVNLSP